MEDPDFGVRWLLPSEVVFCDYRQPQLMPLLRLAPLLVQQVEAKPVLPHEEDTAIPAARTVKLLSHAIPRVGGV